MTSAERSLVSHAELATRNSKRTPSRRCAVTAGSALSSFGAVSAENSAYRFHIVLFLKPEDVVAL